MDNNAHCIRVGLIYRVQHVLEFGFKGLSVGDKSYKKYCQYLQGLIYHVMIKFLLIIPNLFIILIPVIFPFPLTYKSPYNHNNLTLGFFFGKMLQHFSGGTTNSFLVQLAKLT